MQDLSALTLAQLKPRLKALGLSQKGRKADLVARLSSPPMPSPAAPDGHPTTHKPAAVPSASAIAHVASPTNAAEAPRQQSGQILDAFTAREASPGTDTAAVQLLADVVPGTARLDAVASAQVMPCSAAFCSEHHGGL